MVTGPTTERRVSGSRRHTLTTVAVLPAAGAVALVLMVPGGANYWPIPACATGFLLAWTRSHRPWLATGVCLLVVGAVAALPRFPLGLAALGAALCAAFLLLADAAESGAGLTDLRRWMVSRWWWLPAAAVAVGATVLGTELPVIAAPAELVIGAAAVVVFAWLATTRR